MDVEVVDVEEGSYAIQNWREDLQAAKEAFILAQNKINTEAFVRLFNLGICRVEFISTIGRYTLEKPTIVKESEGTYIAWDDRYFVRFSSETLMEAWTSTAGFGIKVKSISVKVFA